MERARAEGKPIGRPKLTPEQVTAIQQLLRKRQSIRTFAVSVGIGHGTVQRIRASMRPGGGRRRRHLRAVAS
jgi:DNA invertase Pin-like site-specific DNA recombinase